MEKSYSVILHHPALPRPEAMPSTLPAGKPRSTPSAGARPPHTCPAATRCSSARSSPRPRAALGALRVLSADSTTPPRGILRTHAGCSPPRYARLLTSIVCLAVSHLGILDCLNYIPKHRSLRSPAFGTGCQDNCQLQLSIVRLGTLVRFCSLFLTNPTF